MNRSVAISLIVMAAAIVLAGFLWQRDHIIPPYIVVVFSKAQKALWISGEKRTDSVTVKQGTPIVTVNGQQSRPRINVSGIGTLQYKNHLIVVLEHDVLVDGSSLGESDNWVLLPDGRLVQGFIRTFD